MIFSTVFQVLSPADSVIDVDAMFDSPPMTSLDRALGSPLAEPMSDDFNYAAALNSDVMSPILKKIIKDHPIYGVDKDNLGA